jgi:hypothetical protein
MLEIHNYYEQLVTEKLMKMAKNNEELTHREYMEDVACLALNTLPSRYVRSLVDLHSHFSYKDTEEMDKQVMDAISKAMLKVRRRSEQARES